MVGRIKYGKGSVRIVEVYVNGDMKKKIRRVKGMDEGEGEGRSLQGKDRERGKVNMEGEEGEKRERNSKDSKKRRRENVGKGDKGEGMDDYEWRNKGR